MPSAPAKKARIMDIKCRSLSLSLLFQSSKSADKSISSAVQKEATCCLYMFQRLGCSIGKREKRDPLSSVLQMGSTKESVDFDDTEAAPPRGVLVCWGASVFLSLVAPPRSLPQRPVCVWLTTHVDSRRRLVRSGLNIEEADDIHVKTNKTNKQRRVDSIMQMGGTGWWWVGIQQSVVAKLAQMGKMNSRFSLDRNTSLGLSLFPYPLLRCNDNVRNATSGMNPGRWSAELMCVGDGSKFPKIAAVVVRLWVFAVRLSGSVH